MVTLYYIAILTYHNTILRLSPQLVSYASLSQEFSAHANSQFGFWASQNPQIVSWASRNPQFVVWGSPSSQFVSWAYVLKKHYCGLHSIKTLLRRCKHH